MDLENIKNRLRKFVLEHPEMTKSGFLKGIDPSGKIVIVVNGEDKLITIDELENGHLKNDQPSEKIETIEETMPNNVVSMPINQNEEIEVMEEVQTVKSISNLKDMEDAVNNKDEVSINKALETFALDNNTGAISMNKAIKIVTDNSIDNIVNSIRDNTKLFDDLSKYDITGKFNEAPIKSDTVQDVDSLIDSSFNNIMVYVDISRLKNIVYTDEQIQKAKNKYSTSVKDRINVLGLNNQKDNVIKIEPDNKKEEESLTMQLKPDMNIKKAGFADILILTIILLIYAAIIINLISKLQ